MQSAFDSAADFVEPQLAGVLKSIDPAVKAKVYEVRLRASRPVVLVSDTETLFLYPSGRTGGVYSPSAVSVTEKQLCESFSRMCGYSVHSNTAAAASGFLSLAHGHRAGVCGTAVLDGEGRVKTFRDVSSINLRIAHEVIGSGEYIFSSVFSGGLASVMVAGAPMSGKTTVLRDLARLLSGPAGGRFYRTAVVDERGEIGAVSGGNPQCDVGFADVLTAYPKAVGIVTATRTLSPEVIICDEIGTLDEARRVLEGMNSGVHFILSIHARSIEEVYLRPSGRELLSCDAFSKLVLLGELPGERAKIYDLKERKYACGRSCTDGGGAVLCRELCGKRTEPACESA